jgi:2,3-bisphosphoglycerate-dependent phosphoglycerate mutase
MPRLVLLRHGQSVWNHEKRFTGWADVDLTEAGVREAQRAAVLLRRHDIIPQVCFTSYLRRAVRTLWIVMDHMDLMWLPVVSDWRLNERHYGALQGRLHSEVAAEMGQELVHAWRRSYGERPPPLAENDSRYPRNEERYADLGAAAWPVTESMADTVKRVVPVWDGQIVPALRGGQTVIISAHNNSLRALIMHLDRLSPNDVPGLEIPTGRPLIYELDADIQPTHHFYLHETQPQAVPTAD